MILQNDGLTSHDREPWAVNYPIYLRNLLNFAKIQALGLPEHSHGIFTRYSSLI
jgi:hypothetical protein